MVAYKVIQKPKWRLRALIFIIKNCVFKFSANGHSLGTKDSSTEKEAAPRICHTIVEGRTLPTKAFPGPPVPEHHGNAVIPSLIHTVTFQRVSTYY
jgi:hypothetical protein